MENKSINEKDKIIKSKEETIWDNRMEYLTSQGLIKEDMFLFQEEIPLVKEIMAILERENTPVIRIEDILTLVKYHSMFSGAESYNEYKK